MQRSGFADVDAGAMRAHIQIVQVCTAARAAVAGAVNQQCRFEEPAARERGQAIRSVFPLSGQRLHHRIAVQLVAASVAHGLQFGVVAQVQEEQYALIEIQAGGVPPEAAAHRQGAFAENERLAVGGGAVSQRGQRVVARCGQDGAIPPGAGAHLLGQIGLFLWCPPIHEESQGSQPGRHESIPGRHCHGAGFVRGRESRRTQDHHIFVFRGG